MQLDARNNRGGMQLHARNSSLLDSLKLNNICIICTYNTYDDTGGGRQRHARLHNSLLDSLKRNRKCRSILSCVLYMYVQEEEAGSYMHARIDTRTHRYRRRHAAARAEP